MRDYQVQREAWERTIVDTIANYVRFPWDLLPSDDKSEVEPPHPDDAHDDDDTSTSQDESTSAGSNQDDEAN
jgi:hypothetical protein